MAKVTAPTPWQAKVLAVPDQINLALFGGRGSGKTVAYQFLALRHCQLHGAKAQTLIIRETWQSLNQLWSDICDLFHAAYPSGLSTNKHEFTIKTPDGATVTLSNLNDDRDVRKLQGVSANLLIVDEMTNMPDLSRVAKLQANLRGSSDVPVRLIYAGNPGGPSHGTIGTRFVNGKIPWRPFTLEDGSEWIYAPSVYLDNPTIDRERYHGQLVASAGGDRALAAAWIQNDWSEIAGAFFGDVWGPHLVIPDIPWRVPNSMLSAVSLDWGMSAPAVALFAAQIHRPWDRGPGGLALPKGSWIVLDEVHTARANDPSKGLGWPPQVMAEECLAACERWAVAPTGVGDDARGLSGETLLDQFADHGLYLQKPVKGAGSREAGWVKLKAMMAASRDGIDSPQIKISERCKLTLATVPLVPRDERRREDVDTDSNEHCADALRYLVTQQDQRAWSGSVTGQF